MKHLSICFFDVDTHIHDVAKEKNEGWLIGMAYCH